MLNAVGVDSIRLTLAMTELFCVVLYTTVVHKSSSIYTAISAQLRQEYVIK